MYDIFSAQMGSDLTIKDNVTPKAANVLNIQLGSLEYAPDFGVDFRFFMTSNFQFQNETFKSYVIERLLNHQISPIDVTETLTALEGLFEWTVGEVAQPTLGFIV